MYVPAHFEETDAEGIEALVRAFPLATLVAHTGRGLVANHLPLLLVKPRELSGHVARANDLHRDLAAGSPVLAIFRGEDSYVSPNWYPTKPLHHRHVPTWNYQVVHVQGAIHFQHDEASKRAAVGRLTKAHEARVNGDAGWKMADAPRDYIDAMLGAIVAFRIEITGILGKSKLSQNRAAEDFASVAEAMEHQGRTGLAGAMRRLRRDG